VIPRPTAPQSPTAPRLLGPWLAAGAFRGCGKRLARRLQKGGGASVAGRAEADPELTFVLLRLAEDVVWPVTAVDGEADPCVDSFALDEVGGVLLSALRDWARDSPSTAVLGIARSIIRFAVNIIPDPDHADTADTLEAMRDERLVLAHTVRTESARTHHDARHRPSGAHPLGGRCAPVRPAAQEWCASGGVDAVERTG
jgi:hypothetical protein